MSECDPAVPCRPKKVEIVAVMYLSHDRPLQAVRRDNLMATLVERGVDVLGSRWRLP